MGPTYEELENLAKQELVEVLPFSDCGSIEVDHPTEGTSVAFGPF